MPYASEIRDMPTSDILRSLEEAKEEMFNLRFQRATGQLADETRIRRLKRNIARFKTILREREIAAELVRQEQED